MNNSIAIFTSLGGFSGVCALFWVIVDWARKDERQRQLTERVDRLEKRADELESVLVSHVKDISVAVARIEQRLEMEGIAR
jgi:hypothetical protein